MVVLLLPCIANAEEKNINVNCDNSAPKITSQDSADAPANFVYKGNRIVFVDFLSVEVKLQLDVKADRATADAVVEFYQPECGLPIIELIPQPDTVIINGQKLQADNFTTLHDPDNQSHFGVLYHELPPGNHRLSLSYEVNDENSLSFHRKHVDFFTYMDDWEERPYSERYFPANFVHDHYKINISITVTNTDVPHKIFTNGDLTENGDNSFAVAYPPYSNSAWPYIHVTGSKRIKLLKKTYRGIEADFPVTIYGRSKKRLKAAMVTVMQQLEILEQNFGPYPFDKMLVGINDSINMEYAGATMVDNDTIEHEMAHMWFGRSVFPKNGDAEWIDEAIAAWHDYGYKRADKIDYRTGVQLSGFSPYRRNVPVEAYNRGAKIMAMLDRNFASQGGLKPILKHLFSSHMFDSISTPEFLKLLDQHSPTPLDKFFNRKIYRNNKRTSG